MEEVIDLGLDSCVLAVKWVQKANLGTSDGDWAEYIKAKKLTNTLKDPARHHVLTLRQFLQAVLSHTASLHDAGTTSHAQLVRYLQWLSNRHKEQQALEHGSVTGVDAPSAHIVKGSTITDQDPVWNLVDSTAQHSTFQTLYDMPSYQKGWHRTPRVGADRAKRPRLLAVDCEMCCTVKDERALVKVCVVDESGDVVLQTLVDPGCQVLDYKTRITGVDAAALQGVHPSRKDVTRFLKRLLGPQVALVGHSLHNDLAALRLDHVPVIDTALLFSYRGLPKQKPSLAALAQTVLQATIRLEGHHDPAEDARTAMQLVLHQLERGGDMQLQPPDAKVDKEELRKLLVHNIPGGTPAASLLSLFAAPSCPKPLCIEDAAGHKINTPAAHATMPAAAAAAAAANAAAAPAIAAAANGTGVGGSGGSDDIENNSDDGESGHGGGGGGSESLGGGLPAKVQLVFQHAGLANEAFKTLRGKQQQDSAGRFSKQVTLTSGQSLVVRKNACHNGSVYGKLKGPQQKRKRSKGTQPQQPQPQPQPADPSQQQQSQGGATECLAQAAPGGTGRKSEKGSRGQQSQRAATEAAGQVAPCGTGRSAKRSIGDGPAGSAAQAARSGGGGGGGGGGQSGEQHMGGSESVAKQAAKASEGGGERQRKAKKQKVKAG